MSVQNYLRAVSDAWNDYDGDTLANYLSFQDRHAANPKLQIENPEEDVDRELEPPIGKKCALKKYDQFTLNTSCFWGSTRSNITLSCAISRNFCYKNMNKLI